MEKTNAKDYLLEFITRSGTPEWLGSLIRTIIDTNGQISEKEKEYIFSKLLEENDLAVTNTDIESSNAILDTPEAEASDGSTAKEQKLTIDKITHVVGVNALIPNQSIILSPSCTVVYGLNGTGKSGYFRIINELSGGKRKKSILSNVRIPGDSLEVDIDFSLDSVSQETLKWKDRNERGVAPFNQIQVFDSEYLPIFLNERESTVNITPLGLHLFQVITSLIDGFKQQLEVRIQEYKATVPEMSPLIDSIHSLDLKGIFENRELTAERLVLLKDYISITEDQVYELNEFRKQKESLENKNSADSCKLLDKERGEIEFLRNHILLLKQKLEEITISVSDAIEDIVIKKRNRDEKIKQFEVLKSIPSLISQEWQFFVEAAENYGVLINSENTNKKTCLYCRQNLGDEAIQLIKAYTQYLADRSQEEYKAASEKIAFLTRRLESLVISCDITKDLSGLLTGATLKNGSSLKIVTDQVLVEASKQRSLLLDAMSSCTAISKSFSLFSPDINDNLISLSKLRKDKVDILNQTEADKKKTVGKIKEAIEKLEDKQIVSKWKEKIRLFFSLNKKIQKFIEANKKITTTGITVLGSKAHDELLTDTIRKSFESELRALEKDIEVTLEKTSAGKGTVHTCIKMSGGDIENILSDGEQKAVCLALFLGEISRQPGNPIVFDDPITSIDHEVADLFAKRLLQISTGRQVVVFTHNKLFYDSFYFWGNSLKNENNIKTHHICKNYTKRGCDKSGLHVYTYTVGRESKDRVGVIFERQNESCQYFVNKAYNALKGSYSVSVISNILKSAIEYYIDEKMLKNQCLLRDRGRGENILWEELGKVAVDITVLSKLKNYWDNLSSRGTHLTQSSSQNPPTKEYFLEIINFLNQ